MDGNFQAEHMKMRNPENDVPLSDGAGFMISKKPYDDEPRSRQWGKSLLNSKGVGMQVEGV